MDDNRNKNNNRISLKKNKQLILGKEFDKSSGFWLTYSGYKISFHIKKEGEFL